MFTSYLRYSQLYNWRTHCIQKKFFSGYFRKVSTFIFMEILSINPVSFERFFQILSNNKNPATAFKSLNRCMLKLEFSEPVNSSKSLKFSIMFSGSFSKFFFFVVFLINSDWMGETVARRKFQEIYLFYLFGTLKVMAVSF